MREAVQKWIDAGADPVQGIALLERVGAKPFTIRLLKANTKSNAQKIKDELCRLTGNSQTAPLKAKSVERQSFREEFPFLNLPSCPIELQALVTRKFTSHGIYTREHAMLTDCTSLNECASRAKLVVDNFKENRAIFAELDYYKKHNALLGKHPIFKHFRKIALLREMSVKELVKLQTKLKHNIWRIESEIKKGDKKHLDAERQEQLNQKLAELAEINRLLGE